MFMGGGDTKEIDPEIRTAVDEQVKEWVDQGKAYIHPGVLFLDDSHLLDLEAFSFLGRALESELVPIIILATNRGVTKIRGTDVESLLGFPLDLIDRSVIISTDTYDQSAIKEILKIRAEQEEISLDDSALSRLTEIGAETSLRYSVQLLSLAAQNAKGRDGEEVGGEDVDRVASLFKSAEEAASYLRKYEEELLKH